MKEYMTEPGKLPESDSSDIFTLELFPQDKNKWDLQILFFFHPRDLSVNG